MTQSPSPQGGISAASRRRLAVPAALAAGGVLAVLLLQGILRNLVATVSLASSSVLTQVGGQLGMLWLGQFQQFFLISVPFALGVFVAFWLLAPIEPGTRLPRLLLRSLAAVGVGALAAIAVSVLVVLFGSLVGANFFGSSFPDLGGPLRTIWYTVLSTVSNVLNVGVTALPTVFLAALLTQLWLRRRGGAAPGAASVV